MNDGLAGRMDLAMVAKDALRVSGLLGWGDGHGDDDGGGSWGRGRRGCRWHAGYGVRRNLGFRLKRWLLSLGPRAGGGGSR